jgi:pyruvate/2-oxoglutarate dehydrogenase complex dihydrolipoamide acyltransferase (E2) component
MAYDLNLAGKFRSNPAANSENATRLVDRDEPGSAGTDTGTVALSGKSTIQGIKYAGKDGVVSFIPFSREDSLTQERIEYPLPAASSPQRIQDAIHELIDRQEVDSIVSVTQNSGTATSIDVEHTGSGTLSAIVVDGADNPISRVNVAGAQGVGIAQVSTSAEDTEASDAAAKLAGQHGVDISKVTGTGKNGTVTKADVQAVIDNP